MGENTLAVNIARVVILAGPLLVAWVLQATVNFLRPGKRGRFTAERTHFYEDMDLDTLKKFMRERLLMENFRITEETDPYVLEARRLGHRPSKSMMDAYPYPKLQLKVRVEFLPDGRGTNARMIVNSLSYVIRDTGESEYLVAFLDYLMGKKTFHEVKPDLNSNCESSVYIAAITVFSPWAIFPLGFSEKEYTAVAFINIVPILTAVIQTIHGIIQISSRPTQSYGYGFAALGFGLSLLAAISTVAAVLIYTGTI